MNVVMAKSSQCSAMALAVKLYRAAQRLGMNLDVNRLRQKVKLRVEMYVDYCPMTQLRLHVHVRSYLCQICHVDSKVAPLVSPSK